MKLKRIAFLSGGFVATAAAAFAHPGHGPADSFAGGLLHPLTGWDHILAMVAVGMWAAQLRSTRIIPAAFVAALVAGAALGHAFGPIGGIEQGIVASVFCLGLLVACAAEVPAAGAACLAAGFAVFHGWAHGAEMPASFGGAAYGLGFAAASVALMAAGIVAARVARPQVVRLAGAGLVLASLALAVA